MTNFIDFTVTPDDAKLWLGALIHAVHGANSTFDSRLAIDFPDWEASSKDERGKPLRDVHAGLRLRVRGSAPALEAFANSAVPAKFRRNGVAKVSGIQTGPPDEAFHYFVRDRTSERRTPGEQARRARRREQRGNNPAVAGSVRLGVREAVVFDVASSSRETRFPLRIARIESATPVFVSGYSTYGLASG